MNIFDGRLFELSVKLSFHPVPTNICNILQLKASLQPSFHGAIMIYLHEDIELYHCAMKSRDGVNILCKHFLLS